ncbi:hypothetical protein [Micromonospora sp. NPDC049679]|uniref:hypothetical protein n=1 Tax=Micromonospora sp. NPDC049679 TaxID=3155920 RepID=UPI0033F4005C
MATSPQLDDPAAVLLTPGERLGWIFSDRNGSRRRFGDPPPAPPTPPYDLIARAQAVKRKQPGRMITVGAVGLTTALLLGCCGVAVGLVHDRAGTALGTLTVLALAVTAGAMALVRAYYGRLKGEVKAAEAERRAWYDRAYADWSARRAAFDRDEETRIEALPEWRAATLRPDARRVDIVGGSLWGWEAVLTVLGASLLATRAPLTVVDFSGEAVGRELLRVAQENGVDVDLLFLPDDLAESDLLAGLDRRQLVDVLVEAMHGDEQAGRAERALDDRILTAICDALGDDLSMPRLVAALRVLLDEPAPASVSVSTGDTSSGEPSPGEVLTARERERIAGELFGEEVRRQAHPALRRMEAYLTPLAALGTRRRVREPATLTCLAAATDGRTARGELLDDLVVQWLIRRVAAGAEELGSLVIAGADDLPRRDIERLSDLCERRGVRLVLLFRHLRDASAQTLGGGAVGFMRLANHDEARQAADFIGRQHRFTLTRVTRTLGGAQTHSTAETEGTADSEGRSSHGLLGLIATRGRDETRTWSVTRNWSQTRSVADAINWSEAGTRERVYEYAVEPRALQDLPDYALLLVQWQPSGSVVVPVECNPDLISLPRLSMDPLLPVETAPPAVESAEATVEAG